MKEQIKNRKSFQTLSLFLVFAMGGGDALKDEESSRSSSSTCTYFSSFSNQATDLRRREKDFQKILESHDRLLKTSKKKLKLARNQILSYTPGSWADVKLSKYDIPKKTSILIVGPKGAGKSGLVNRITRVIEDDEFAPARAQESYGSKGGTFFVQEYVIPRGSCASFCLYDTRGLTQVSSIDNISKIEQWITRGVHHGEPVIWTSDSTELKDRLIRDSETGCEIRKVNSVIFVVDAVEILKSMESETSYAHMISKSFNCPLLSFKDDKPALVMTHGDILSREECARVRIFLGELLGIPPDKQIFDIPESEDAATVITICNLICYSLEHADKNLQFVPKKNFSKSLQVLCFIFETFNYEPLCFQINCIKVGGGVTERISILENIILVFLPLLIALAIIFFIPSQNVSHESHHKLHVHQSPPQLYNLTLKPLIQVDPIRTTTLFIQYQDSSMFMKQREEQLTRTQKRKDSLQRMLKYNSLQREQDEE